MNARSYLVYLRLGCTYNEVLRPNTKGKNTIFSE